MSPMMSALDATHLCYAVSTYNAQNILVEHMVNIVNHMDYVCSTHVS
jgi:hypothetical protein